MTVERFADALTWLRRYTPGGFALAAVVCVVLGALGQWRAGVVIGACVSAVFLLANSLYMAFLDVHSTMPRIIAWGWLAAAIVLPGSVLLIAFSLWRGLWAIPVTFVAICVLAIRGHLKDLPVGRHENDTL